jgi:putative ABC transport system ATP-binding protein
VHRDLVRTDPRYRSVVTRETDEERAVRGVPGDDGTTAPSTPGEQREDDENALRDALEEIEEKA